ncbi:MAG TPA: allantoicase [Rhodothermales bacterium]|nr:allantoicase [Rhodothermales bacterium]
MYSQTIKEIIKEAPSFTKLTYLAAEAMGGEVLYATDEFFAEKENLIKPGRGVFIADKYTDRGKWMDGWESRRRRTPGHDYAVIRLAATGIVAGFDIDTNHFTGNHPPFASIEGIVLEPGQTVMNWDDPALRWEVLLPRVPLDPGSHNYYLCHKATPINHVRLHIYPDGGVARFRVYGEVQKDWSSVSKHESIDLAAALNGGHALACNDMYFSDMRNLILPQRGINMGDGWETKRSRTPNHHDWVILRLGHPGVLGQVLVDTAHFKGNYPDFCTLEGCMASDDEQVLEGKVEWQALMPPLKLQADHEHWADLSKGLPPVSHVRFSIYPDGGVSRLRLFGHIV